MKQDLLDKIKSRGYWRVNFQPLVYAQKLNSLGECKEIVERTAVHLRGWDYPHFPGRTGEDTGLEPGENYYVGWIDCGAHKEFWHMYQSSQFLHYVALREDWMKEDPWYQGVHDDIKPMSSLGIVGSVVYQLTEIFEFLFRLTNAGIYDEGVLVSISLNNTQNRQLWIEDRMRVPFLQPYKTAAEKIEFNGQYIKDQIITSPKNEALKVVLYIFDRFGWHNPSIETIKKDQDNLLIRRV